LREIETILAAYDSAKQQKKACVLATVVHVEGSSYRRAGARMLVDEEGVMTGAISGGCLEGDALRKALNALYQQTNKLVSYDTSDEEDAVIGAQLGCNGVIQVLFEPIDFSNAKNPLELLRMADRDFRVVCTFFHLDRSKPQGGTRLIIDGQLHTQGEFAETLLKDQLLQDARQAFEEKNSLFKAYTAGDAKYYVFLELFKPPIQLVIVGAGNDAQVLAQMAEILGWQIVVTDGRSTHARPDRFTSSCQVIVAKPEDTLQNIRLNEQTAVVLMTHNYQYDLAVLELLKAYEQVPYIGILGPKKKYQRMLDELTDTSGPLPESFLEKIYAPVGLDIGAETPAEIALSVLSEIQAVLTHTPGMPLKQKSGPIHQKKNNEFKSVILP